ncbi:MAG: MFS transporter, partial [Pyrinomonadaceae bacterium]
GFVVGGLLAYYFGWRFAFMLVGIPGCVTAVLLWRLKEPIRGANDQKTLIETDKTRIVWWRMVWMILSTRGWLLSTAGYTAVTFALGAFATWATTLLVRDKGMTEGSAAITIGIIVLVAGAAGSFSGGWIADRLAVYRKDAYFLVCAYSVLFSIIPTIIVLRSTDYFIFIPAIFVMVTLLFVSNAPFFTILVGSVPFNVRSTAVALNIVAIHTFGDTISRAATGVISDELKAGRMMGLAEAAIWFGFDPAHHLSIALLIAPAALVVSTLLFFLGAAAVARASRP